MKKLLITKKKKRKVSVRSRSVCRWLHQAACLLTAIGFLYGNTETALAQEEKNSNTTITYVYHKHIGSGQTEEGCFRKPVFHIHEGEEGTGGKCFETPVYHVHQGDTGNGGSCYQKEVFHIHEGEESAGGGCYEPVYHSHSGSCYGSATCNYSVSKGNSFETYDEYCFHHGNTGHSKAYATEHHNDCGAGNVPTTVSYCRKCKLYGDSGSHTYSVLSCSKGNEIEGYRLGCGKTQDSVDGYELDCPKTEDTIDSYTLSCQKTGDTIDSYDRDCGKDETTPYGKITLTNETSGTGETVLISAAFENLDGGEFELAEDPYTWYDGKGNMIGTGEQLQVSENGTYAAKVLVTNEDVNPGSLKAKITVGNIIKPVKPDNDHEKEEDKKDTGENDGNQGEQESPEEPVPTRTPEMTIVSEMTGEEAVNQDVQVRKLPAKPVLNAQKEEKAEIPDRTPAFQKKTRVVKAEEKKSEKEEILTIHTVPEKNSIFESAAVKILTVTVGSLFALGGVLAGFYLIRWSVRVYNDDGLGKWVYLGRCIVKTEEDGFFIRITDRMTEKASTNRYCIRPGLFLDFQSEEDELLVCREEKRISVYLSKEMIVVL